MPRSRARLTLCPLDHRVVPAVVLTTLDLDGDGTADDVRIVGGLQSSKVIVVDNGAGAVLIAIDANGDGDSADPGDTPGQAYPISLNSVVFDVRLGGGNDEFAYHASGDFNSAGRTLALDLGGGRDTFTFNVDGNSVVNHSRLSLDVTGGGGADAVTAVFGLVDASAVSVTAALGAGADAATMTLGSLSGSAAAGLTFDLGAGPNTFSGNFSGISTGAVDLAVTGGNQPDKVEMFLHGSVGQIGSSARFDAVVDLLGGNDTFTGSLDALFSAFRVDDHSQCSIAVRGGAGDDVLALAPSGFNLLAVDVDALFSASLDGGAGNDTVSADFGTATAWGVLGTLRVRVNGGLGIDFLTCRLGGTSQSAGAFDVAVRGGAGNDAVIFYLQANGGTPTYGPGGGVVLDGGTGIDTLANPSTAVAYPTAFETII